MPIPLDRKQGRCMRINSDSESMQKFDVSSVHQQHSRATDDRSLRVLVTGGTGFIGTRLVAVLNHLHHQVTVLVRNQAMAGALVNDQTDLISDLSQLSNKTVFDVIINLAGEPLAKRRWTSRNKSRFIQSRESVTRALLQLVRRLDRKPEVLISGSAIGYYGPHDDELLNEKGAVSDSFSHQLCQRWENAALEFESLGVRVCCLRIGIVLGHNGGPLRELRRPFDWGCALTLGSGKQWMSWIHRDDLIAIMLFLMGNKLLSGAFNGTAQTPVTAATFTTVLRRFIRAPLKLRMPAKLLSFIIGEMADEILLSGQRVIPERLVNAGYVFQYPTLADALNSLVGAPLADG